MRACDSAGPVVLGFDGGWRMEHLLAVAAGEAARRQATLAIVMVSRPALDPALSTGGRRAADRRAELADHRHLIHAAESVRDRHPQLPVTLHRLVEEQARTAPHPLASAQLLVVGTVGRHGQRVFSPDSVSRILLKAARCAVLVVPHDVPVESEAGPRRRVCVGIGDHSSDAALVRTAWAEAVRRGCDLELVHAYRTLPDEDPVQGLCRAANTVAHTIAATTATAGGPMSVLLRDDDPAAALTRQAGESELLIIGSRLGALSGPVRDSVGLAIISSLHCRLLVVPDPVPDPWSRPALVPVPG